MKIIKNLLLVIAVSIINIYFLGSVSADLASNYPNTIETINDGTSSWSNTNNVIGNNTNTFAEVVMSQNPDDSDTLLIKDFNFDSLDIPVGSTINGIQVDVERNGNIFVISDSSVELTKNGKDSYTNNLANGNAQNNKAITSYGSNNDLWGTTWSDTELKSENFGVLLKYNKTWWFNARNTRVYRVNVIVDFTPPLEESPLDFKITNENYWDTGFCYEFEATNVSALNITNWEIGFNLNGANITSDFGGNYNNLGSGEYVITSPGAYADTINVGQSLTFGLCADNGMGYISNLITKNYQNIGGLVLQDYNISDNGLDVNITTNSSWPGGFCRDIELVNNGNNTINGWEINFELDQNLSSSYGGNYSKNAKNHKITPLSYNKTINPGESQTIGFCSNGTNVDSNWSLKTLSGTAGFCGKYYTGTAAEPYNILNFVTSRTDFDIQFDWGSLSPGEEIPNDDFTVEWEGNFQADESGTYTFRTRSDDGVRLYIDGNIIIDQWVNQAPTQVTGNINLNQGQIYNIRVEYYERNGGAVAELDWQKPSDSGFVSLDGNNVFHKECSGGVFTGLETTFAGGNAQRGNMFDVDVLDQSITIKGFSINPQSETGDIRVYYRNGNYAGFETDSSAWNILGNYSFVGGNGPTFVQTDELILDKNSNYSFYVVVTSGTNLNYTAGSNEGDIYSQDNFLAIREGIGIANEFGPNTWRPRIWNGIIHYDVNFSGNVESGLETTFAGGSGQAGNMFEIDILNNDVIIDALSINTRTQNSSIRVYYKEGVYSGFENSSAGWNLVGDYNFAGNGEGNPTYIPIDQIALNSNTTYSFYVTEVGTDGIRYTAGNNEGDIFAQDPFIVFKEGIGKVFEFQNSFSPRIWNGIIHYTAVIDSVAPTINYQNIQNNDLLPNGANDIIINYNDDSGIDLTSINANLTKWNGTNWGSNILNTYQNNVTSNSSQSVYSLSQLGFGKYKFSFSLSDSGGISNSKDLIFYIDEPSFVVSDGIIDIGNLDNINTDKFSGDITLTVNTVGAGFDIQMNKVGELSYSGYEISDWNGSNGFGYDGEPVTNTIKSINNNQIIASQGKNVNNNGEKKSYVYTIKFGANIDENIAAGSYTGVIDFDIIFDY